MLSSRFLRARLRCTAAALAVSRAANRHFAKAIFFAIGAGKAGLTLRTHSAIACGETGLTLIGGQAACVLPLVCAKSDDASWVVETGCEVALIA
jgi:hypothetical protein